MDLEELSELADEKIKLGNDLITSLATLEQIDGVKKIQRKITQEVKFVEKVRTSYIQKPWSYKCLLFDRYERMELSRRTIFSVPT